MDKGNQKNKRSLSDKETIYALIEGRNKEGLQIFLCPRCNKEYKFNIRQVRYCTKCGQHVSPAFSKEDPKKDDFLNRLKFSDLESGK